jgi:hypothetical protein
MSSVNSEKLEEKIGEAIGLEMAAQKAVEELTSKGLRIGQITARVVWFVILPFPIPHH